MSAPLPPASFWLRLFAGLYDLLPVLALWFVTGALALLVTGGALDYHAPAYRLALLGVATGYYVLSWMRGGQTIGMRAWRLRVVRADGGTLSARQALLRFAVALGSLAAAGLGLLWALVDADWRGWHDLVAGTRVVRLPKP